MLKHSRSDMTVPVLVGAYSIGGLFLGRALRSSTSPVSLSQIVLVGGTSAAAAAVSPMITHRLMCQWSASAPLVNAAVSSGVQYIALRVVGTSMDDSAMFVPVQMASSVLAEYVAKEMNKNKSHKQSE